MLTTYPHGGVAELHGAVGVSGVRVGGGETVLMHDPVGLDALGRAALVEDECLLDADALVGGAAADGLVGAGGLPVAGPRRAVRPDSVGVLAVPGREEVPLPVPVVRLGCN